MSDGGRRLLLLLRPQQLFPQPSTLPRHTPQQRIYIGRELISMSERSSALLSLASPLTRSVVCARSLPLPLPLPRSLPAAEHAEAHAAAPHEAHDQSTVTGEPPAKRKRGRPKGTKVRFAFTCALTLNVSCAHSTNQNREGHRAGRPRKLLPDGTPASVLGSLSLSLYSAKSELTDLCHSQAPEARPQVELGRRTLDRGRPCSQHLGLSAARLTPAAVCSAASTCVPLANTHARSWAITQQQQGSSCCAWAQGRRSRRCWWRPAPVAAISPVLGVINPASVRLSCPGFLARGSCLAVSGLSSRSQRDAAHRSRARPETLAVIKRAHDRRNARLSLPQAAARPAPVRCCLCLPPS